MKRKPWLVLMLLASACTTPASRIRKNQAVFDAYPASVQETIRKGEVSVGFTKEQAALAMGAPDRKFSRKDSGGTVDVWAYDDFAIRPSLGVGGTSGDYGMGLSFERRDSYPEERTRLVFKEGLVSSIETPSK